MRHGRMQPACRGPLKRLPVGALSKGHAGAAQLPRHPCAWRALPNNPTGARRPSRLRAQVVPPDVELLRRRNARRVAEAAQLVVQRHELGVVEAVHGARLGAAVALDQPQCRAAPVSGHEHLPVVAAGQDAHEVPLVPRLQRYVRAVELRIAGPAGAPRRHCGSNGEIVGRRARAGPCAMLPVDRPALRKQAVQAALRLRGLRQGLITLASSRRRPHRVLLRAI